MAGERLRVGVIGTGMIANAGHIPAWKALADDAELVAVADIVEERARKVAEHEGVRHAFGDWRKMLEEVDLDVVSVCTPNAYHKEQTIAAIEAGAHVLCEKPIATSHADAVEMFGAAEAAGKVLMVGQSVRFGGQAMAAKEICESGRLGEVYFAEAMCMRRRGVPKWGQFHMKEHSGGGPIYDLGVHMIDLVYWLMDNPKVEAVSAMSYTKIANRDEGLITSLADSGAPLGVVTPRPYDWREYDVEDMAAAFVRLEGGASLVVKTSWAANVPENTFRAMLLGSEGGLQLFPLAMAGKMGSYQVDISPQFGDDPPGQFMGHRREVAHMVKVIRGEAALIVTREQVLNVMRTLDALYESSAIGAEVVID